MLSAFVGRVLIKLLIISDGTIRCTSHATVNDFNVQLRSQCHQLLDNLTKCVVFFCAAAAANSITPVASSGLCVDAPLQ
jgi:hypothetical protein